MINATIFGRKLSIGETVRFGYNGKNREGIVEKVFANAVCVKLPSGAFKSFSFNKIKPTIKAVVDVDYERRMNIIDAGS